MKPEMKLEMSDVLQTLSASLERLASAASALESSATRLEQHGNAEHGEVQKITAAIEMGALETSGAASGREVELERKLAQAEQVIAALQAEGRRELGREITREESRVSARKTLPAATVQLLAKQGIDTVSTVDVQSLDAALAGLSVEQRIAIKSQMMRTGSLTL